MMEDWFVQNGLVGGVSGVDMGNLSVRFGQNEAVIEAKKAFLENYGIDLANCTQIEVEHDKNVWIVDNPGDEIDCDGLMIDKPGLGLFLLTADCLPVVIYDPLKRVLGLVHGGRAGLEKGVIEECLKVMEQRFGCDSPTLVVWIGPGIRKGSYVLANLDRLDKDTWSGFVEEFEGKYTLDLVGFCIDKLLKLGVKRKKIEDCGVDTVQDKRFFSHYRVNTLGSGDVEGRFGTVVGMV